MARRVVAQAAAFPYRSSPFGGLEVLLVTRRSGGWGVPKGKVEAGDTPAQTARLETMEEAGVLGEVSGPALGRYAYTKRGREHEVLVFPLVVRRELARWFEEERRTRVWVPLPEAARLLPNPQLVGLLMTLRHRLLTTGEALPLAA